MLAAAGADLRGGTYVTPSRSSPTPSTIVRRLDRSHLQEFALADKPRLWLPDPDREIDGTVSEDYRRVKLSRLQPGEQFVYVFDLGDDWAHLCTVGPQRIDPVETLGILPDKPLPYFDWGDIPDHYRRRWDGDDGESPQPRDPGLTGLPPLRPNWGWRGLSPVRPAGPQWT